VKSLINLRGSRFVLASAYALGIVLSGLAPTRGQLWMQTSAPDTNWSSIALSANGRTLIATFDPGPIYLSTNAGLSWMATDAPVTNWSSVACSVDGTKWAAVAGGGIYLSSNSVANWMATGWSSGGKIASSADVTKLVVARIGGFGVYGSSDSGATWTPLPVNGSCAASSADGRKLAAAYFAYPGVLLGGIFVSTNAGMTWTPGNAPLDYWTGWTSLASSADGSTLAATIGYTDWPTGPGPIFFSSDAGIQWQAANSPTSHWNSVACSANGMNMIAAGSAGVYTSKDSGLNWSSNGLPQASWSAVAMSADGSVMVAAAEDRGVWISQLPPRPTLGIAKSGANLFLSWIVPSMDFTLQENSDLTASNWVNITNTPTLNLTSLRHEISLPITDNRKYFRLTP
jgi:hypothetical protein